MDMRLPEVVNSFSRTLDSLSDNDIWYVGEYIGIGDLNGENRLEHLIEHWFLSSVSSGDVNDWEGILVWNIYSEN